MQKIKVLVLLKNVQNNEILKGIYNGFRNREKMVYKEENRIVTIDKNANTVNMIRRENEKITFLTFEKNKIEKGSYKDGQMHMNFIVETSKLEILDDEIHICYQTRIEDEIMGNFDLKLKFEVIE